MLHSKSFRSQPTLSQFFETRYFYLQMRVDFYSQVHLEFVVVDTVLDLWESANNPDAQRVEEIRHCFCIPPETVREREGDLVSRGIKITGSPGARRVATPVGMCVGGTRGQSKVAPENGKRYLALPGWKHSVDVSLMRRLSNRRYTARRALYKRANSASETLTSWQRRTTDNRLPKWQWSNTNRQWNYQKINRSETLIFLRPHSFAPVIRHDRSYRF